MRLPMLMFGAFALAVVPQAGKAASLNPGVSFLKAFLDGDEAGAVALVEGTVEQVRNQEVFAEAEPSAQSVVKALFGCKFAAFFDEMASTSIADFKRSYTMQWSCQGRRVSTILVPAGEKLKLRLLMTMDVVAPPPAPIAKPQRVGQ